MNSKQPKSDRNVRRVVSTSNGRRTTESPLGSQDDDSLRVYKSRTERARAHSQQVDGEKTGRNATEKQDLDKPGAAERQNAAVRNSRANSR